MVFENKEILVIFFENNENGRHQSPPVRGGSSRGSLAVEAVVMWKRKERERKREGKGREGEVAGR